MIIFSIKKGAERRVILPAENAPVFECVFLCLSGACLGKKVDFQYRMASQKDAFLMNFLTENLPFRALEAPELAACVCEITAVDPRARATDVVNVDQSRLLWRCPEKKTLF